MKKDTKNLKCGLIGKPLGHSYSPQIHALLGDYRYDLTELDENEVGDFLKNGDFDAINVTIPYKKTVMPFLDEISPMARAVGSVNTIVRRGDGTLFGHNTDFFGFSYMLDKGKIDITGKKVLILGTGGASMTAQAVAAHRNAREIVLISRSGENNYGNLNRHSDCDVIINTTPVGMYPNNGVSPVPLDVFPKLSGVVDVIYNPEKTALILDAAERGIRCISGLYMLSAQAKEAAEYFTGEKIDDSVIDVIVKRINFDLKNIALIGMPGVGKTTIGKAIAEKTGKKFADTDELITEKAEVSIPDIFAKYGEEKFRDIESGVLEEISKKSGYVIACGGGIVLRKENRRYLTQNSTVVFLKRDLSLLARDGRPLSANADLRAMYDRRLPFYADAADITLDITSDACENAEAVIKAVAEH